MNTTTQSSFLPQKTLHIAPMLGVSNREFRFLMRILSKRVVLWTEMVVDETLLHSTRPGCYLEYDETVEHPIVCQLGGNNPEWAAAAVNLVRQFKYDEINLNCGCPSERTAGKREFGAALLKKPHLTASMMQSIQTASQGTPISVKMRIGVDEQDDMNFLINFIDQLRPFCTRFVIHARKVYTLGLSPSQNRTIPPLNYPRVYETCRYFPDCEFWVNGGIQSLKEARDICFGNKASGYTVCTNSIPDDIQHSVPCSICKAPNGSCVAPLPAALIPPNLRGCMIGRAAIDNPSTLWDVDRYFYGEPTNPCGTRRQVLERYIEFLEEAYPRRCCDQDERITDTFPGPKVKHYRNGCPVCRWPNAPNLQLDCLKRTTDDMTQQGTIRVASRVMDRALKPVLGLFYDLQGSRAFRHACNSLSRDLTVRNCGPGNALRLAMQVVLDDILDRTFVPTEDSYDVHLKPSISFHHELELSTQKANERNEYVDVT